MKKNSYRPKTIAILHIYELENSSYADRTSVIYIRELDTARRCTCMNDRAATDINSNVTTVAYNLSRLCIRKTYLVSNNASCPGRMWKSYAKCCIYTHNETGAVCPVCQTGSTVYIRITDKL